MTSILPLTALGVGPLSGSSGYALIFALCALLFIEECGVPLPFAPGDLVLIVCGITTAANHLQAPVVVAAMSAAVLAGAFAGRELFAVAGERILNRVARFLRVGKAFEKLVGALRRSGWVGVLIGRLTPGLRIHTTEAAGMIHMPRRTFALGLLPAVAIYEAVFFGLGYWVGPPAWSAIQSYTPRPGPLVVMVAALIGLVLLGRWLYRSLGRTRVAAQCPDQLSSG